MAVWSELSTEVQEAIVAYYENKYDVIGINNVRDALTQQCFEIAIDTVLLEIKKRVRRQRVDTANMYEPTSSELVDEIELRTSIIGQPEV